MNRRDFVRGATAILAGVAVDQLGVLDALERLGPRRLFPVGIDLRQARFERTTTKLYRIIYTRKVVELDWYAEP
jgi:hypothetical protein